MVLATVSSAAPDGCGKSVDAGDYADDLPYGFYNGERQKAPEKARPSGR